MRKSAVLILFAMVAIPLSVSAQQPAPAACAALMQLKLPDTKVLRAEQYAAGEFRTSPEATADVVRRAKLLPALCRVTAEIAPTPDSSIRMELWMPAEHWNGRFRGQGNGGFAGEIAYELMGLSVIDGYATAGTDTGHHASFIDAAWAKGHPEKIADFGNRGVHLMTLRSKDFVAAYYGTPAKHSYFGACSDGGREALMEAQRFPTDYDGILAGAPAYNWTALVTDGLYNSQILMATPASFIPPSKLPAITAAAIAACDAKDGVSDGIITDPSACEFKPATLLCKAADSDSCLTAPQVKTLERLYAGAETSSGHQIFPGFAAGGEADPGGWKPWVTGAAPGESLSYGFANGYFSNMVYSGAAKPFDVRTASVDDAFVTAIRTTASALNATNPDIKPFLARGGKLILYHGWSDAAISPYSTIDYYEQLLAITGKENTESSVRFYLAPGMDHCESGPGPDSFGQFGWLPTRGPDDPKRDAYLALEQWVEGGMAPAEIIATKYNGELSNDVKMTRPLCPYPQIAKYNGTGDINQASSFSCSAAAK